MPHRPPVPHEKSQSQAAKASKFGRRAGQEPEDVASAVRPESDNDMEVVEDTDKLAEESPFIDLEAYKGQDDRQAKSLGTPGVLRPSHYIVGPGKVNFKANSCIYICYRN